MQVGLRKLECALPPHTHTHTHTHTHAYTHTHSCIHALGNYFVFNLIPELTSMHDPVGTRMHTHTHTHTQRQTHTLNM